MKTQTTPNIMMVRPANFGYNAETAENNAFQSNETNLSLEEIKIKAKAEFDGFVEKLRTNGVNIIVIDEEDTDAHGKDHPHFGQLKNVAKGGQIELFALL